MSLFLLLVLIAVALGIVGVTVNGLIYLLVIGIVVFLVAFVLLGRGIGRGIALKLAEAGALVAVNYAGNSEAADKTVGEIEATGGKAFALQAKLGEPGEMRDLLTGDGGHADS